MTKVILTIEKLKTLLFIRKYIVKNRFRKRANTVATKAVVKKSPLPPNNGIRDELFLRSIMMNDINKKIGNAGTMHFHANCLLFVFWGGS